MEKPYWLIKKRLINPILYKTKLINNIKYQQKEREGERPTLWPLSV